MKNVLILFSLLCAFVMNSVAQENPPTPGAPKTVSVPAVKEKKLTNGLTVAVVEKKTVPLVTIQLLVKSGAGAEDLGKAGLADITASMLTKGTKTRTATQIAEAVEFLGGSINSGAGWNSSFVSITVTSDKVSQAMAILADVVLNPKFDQKELDLLKSQTLDGLTYSLKQPGFLGNYVATKYSFTEHPAGGTPNSVQNLTRADILRFHKDNYDPSNSVLIFAGDISSIQANAAASAAFRPWKTRLAMIGNADAETVMPSSAVASEPVPVVNRFLVIDLPKSGQASVTYAKPIQNIGRSDGRFYPAMVLNSILGGGYSSRLNLEIRIKRGLSYGAGSSFAWRATKNNFGTRTQTKNESAAEVAELVIEELKKLATASAVETELVPRKSVLTGNFGRNLETTNGLAVAIGDLYSFGISPNVLNEYVANVNTVSDSQVKDFALQNLLGGDIIFVGDFSIFKDDLAKRFPKMTIEVIAADDLDLSRDNLRK
ncbi:MAG: pitrilysin family protein [Pyrinomonadaceae bacterium]